VSATKCAPAGSGGGGGGGGGGVCVCVCVCVRERERDSGATRLHFLIPLTETPFKRLAIGKMPASTVHSTKYLSLAHKHGTAASQI
jgi:hypothetical protein